MRLALVLLLALLARPGWGHGRHTHLHRRRQAPPEPSALALQRTLNEGRLRSAASSASQLHPLTSTTPIPGEAETFYIRKDSNGSLPCLPVISGDSRSIMGKIEWYKGDKKLLEADEKRVVVWNTKNTIAYLPDSGALLFRGVTNDDSGEYHCQLTKQQASETEEGTVRFYVQGKSASHSSHHLSELAYYYCSLPAACPASSQGRLRRSAGFHACHFWPAEMESRCRLALAQLAAVLAEPANNGAHVG